MMKRLVLGALLLISATTFLSHPAEAQHCPSGEYCVQQEGAPVSCDDEHNTCYAVVQNLSDPLAQQGYCCGYEGGEVTAAWCSQSDEHGPFDPDVDSHEEACNPPEENEEDWMINATVKNESEQPLSSIQVDVNAQFSDGSIRGNTSTTDSDGNLTTTIQYPDSLTRSQVIFTACNDTVSAAPNPPEDGYYDVVVDCDKGSGDSDDDEDGEEKTITVTGSIVNSSDGGVDSVDVDVTLDLDAGSETNEPGTSDGSYETDFTIANTADPNSVTVTAEHTNRQDCSNETTKENVDGDTIAMGALDLPCADQGSDEYKAITVSGYVENASDDGVNNADVFVELQDDDDDTYSGENTTDDGDYQNNLSVPTSANIQSATVTARESGQTSQICENTTTESSFGSLNDGDEITMDDIELNCASPGPSDSLCPNGEINQSVGEECDPDADPVFPEQHSDLRNDPQASCTDQCTIDDPSSEQCSSDNCDACEGTGDDVPPACRDDTCPTEPDQINFDVSVAPDNQDGQTTLTVEWQTDNSNCDITDPYVELKNNTVLYTSDSQGASHDIIKPRSFYNPGDTYTVTVNATINTNTVEDTVEYTPSNPICDRRRGESFCGSPGEDSSINRVTCDSEGLIVDDETIPCQDNDKICVQVNAESAECRSASLCSMCAGPYHLFTKTTLIPPSNPSKSCSDYYYDNVCYYENQTKHRSVRGEASACDVSTCSDYTSESTCEANPCGTTTTNNCEWKSISDGLSRGFCTDASTEKPSDCTQCGGDTCTDHICETVLSDTNPKTCLFNSDAAYEEGEPISEANKYEQYRCQPRQHSGCRTYDNQQECINGTNVSINSTNGIETESDDYFGFGVCKFDPSDPGQCIKDRDGNGEPDCERGDQRCVTDMQAPETLLLGVGDGRMTYGALTRLEFSVSDNAYPESEVTTNITLNEKSIDSGALEEEIKNTNNGRRTSETITYWSEDPANNLEPKNQATIQLYSNLQDTLTFNVSKEIYQADATTRKGRINASVGSLPEASTDRNITCEYTVDHREDLEPTTIWDSNNSRASNVTFDNLRSGTYDLSAECHDTLGQTYRPDPKSVQISLANNISDVQPFQDETSTSSVEITATTETDQRCQYSNLSGGWQDFQNTGGTSHTDTVTHTRSRVYQRDVRCKAEDDDTWSDGENNRIVYAIDRDAPTIDLKLFNETSDDGFTVDEPVRAKDNVSVKLTCQETRNLGTPNWANPEFGCKEVKDDDVADGNMTWCVGEDCDPSNTYQSRFEVDVSNDNSTYINVKVEDDGGNTRTPEYQLDRVTDTSLRIDVTVEPRR